jgi:WD40 repeat protein
MKIFISYARADDETFVKQLYQDLTEHDFYVWWDRKAMESRGRTFLQELRDAIEASDRLIAVIGPKAVTSDYVRAEWEHALLFAKGVVPILRMGDYDLVPSELSKIHCPDFRKEQPYNEALEELLGILTEPVPPLGALRTEVPSLPPHFLPRRHEITRLGETVLADVKRPTIVTSAKQTTALQGMGGIGKSVTAAAFARATETRRAFTDGVIWLTIGQNPDPFSNLKLVGLAFGDDPVNYVNLDTARARLPRVLSDKVCLIVLDDVWNVVDVTPFRNALGSRCRLLITTRDGGLITALGAQEHRLDVLNNDQAQALLVQWADQPVDTLPPEAEAVADECGNLPLALAIVGAMLRGKQNRWENILHKLRNADLEKIRKQFPNYPYPDILRAIQVSVEALEPEVQKRYLDFSVFPEKIPISEAVLQAFWEPEGLDEFDTQDIADTLVDKSLAQRDHADNLILHDLQLDYVRKQVGDLPSLHDRLLEAYRLKCTNGWSTGPNDGYFFEHLAYHLVEAEHKENLRKLLFDFNWIQAKLDAIDVNSLITDYDHLPDDHILHLVQGAIRLSAHIIEKDKNQLVEQLLGRLQSFQEPEIQSMLEQARTSKECIWLHPLTTSLTPPGGPLIRTLEGHTGEVSAVAVTPDCRYAISASYDQTLKVWDVKSGEELQTLKGHTNWVIGVAVTPDCRYAISASSDYTLKVWDIKSGKELQTLKGHGSSVTTVDVTCDGKLVISASRDNTLKVWDIEKRKKLQTLKGHTDWVNAVAITSNGKLAISASGDRTLKLWNIKSGKELQTLKGHTDWISAVAVTSNGELAISGSRDKTLKVWNIKSGKELQTLKGHTDWISAVTVTSNGELAISGSRDKTLKVWNIKSGKELRTLKGHAGVISAVAVTIDGKLVISASQDKSLKVWDIESPRELHILKDHADLVTAVAVTTDGKYAISASSDKTLKVWDIKGGEELRTLKGHTNWVMAVTVTSDDRYALSASNDNTLKVWDIKSGEELRTLKGHTNGVMGVAVTPDGKFAISASDDHTLKVWDVKSGEELRTLKGHTGWVKAVAVTRDGKYAISASSDKTLKVWDIISGEELQTLKGHVGLIWAVAFMSNGRLAISASHDKTLKVWNIKTGGIITSFRGDDSLHACTVLPDGVTIIVGDATGRVHFLRLEGGKS